MSALFEELDYAPTPIGAISLRRRRILALDTDVFEILLGDEHLMSSLFTASEVALAQLGLAALGEAPAEGWDVVVGGLGLGYTAATVLEDARREAASTREAARAETIKRLRQTAERSAGFERRCQHPRGRNGRLRHGGAQRGLQPAAPALLLQLGYMDSG